MGGKDYVKYFSVECNVRAYAYLKKISCVTAGNTVIEALEKHGMSLVFGKDTIKFPTPYLVLECDKSGGAYFFYLLRDLIGRACGGCVFPF